jgi:hypothetical protein
MLVKISDLMFWRKKQESKQMTEAPKSAQITPANLKNFIVKAIGLGGGSSSGDFQDPDYDLSEIKTAANADSYIKISLQKYSQLVFKAGYSIVGQNDQAAEYIRTRFRIMSFATGNPMDITFQEIADDLIKYSNAFLMKSRMDGTPMGGIQAKGVLDTKPVGGYFRVDPTTIKIKRDKTGVIKQYQQSVENETKAFKPTDVIHFYLDREGGAAFGTPRIVAALEDVKLLRKIEGNVLSLIYRFAIPLYQMKIGLPEAGFMATDKEITDAKTEVEKMAPDGILVTNERTEFVAVGAEGEALDATGYLTYFEKRAFTALNMSEAMMGRGGSKQDADSMEGQVHDTVTFIQRIMSIFLENFLINELLLEGGYNPIANEQDIVNFEFEEINLDTKVKMENHAMTQFQGNAISFEEMRKSLGQRADNVDETRLYANMIQQKNAIEQIDAKNNGAMQVAGARAGTSTSSGSGGNGQVKTPKTSGAITNRNRPQNQHGTTSAKVKEFTEASDEDVQIAISKKNIDNYKKNFSAVYKKYKDARNDICEHHEKAEIILPVVKDGIVKELKHHILFSAQDGMQKAFRDNGRPVEHVQKLSMALLEDNAEQTVIGLFKDVQKKIKGKEADRQHMEAVFDAMEYRLRFLTEYVIPKAYWYAYVKACAHMGVEKVYIDFDGSDDKEEHSHVIDTGSFSLDDIPAFNAYCDCKIGIKKAGD